ncbi:hypothetical protein [Caldicellulosiruptor morganii]|uniref:Uncharacterized protein n=1 Tax=Caldicellulosiruptor morganii TaxID=1387555 RepID=A0ABY7BMB5_9FIRM|nr:hypothetical protein [Caldicellulosiruptor morganii]WAM33993.1 hypothetical protein OTK00_000136 [Caldicellulosiruptor morganii]
MLLKLMKEHLEMLKQINRSNSEQSKDFLKFNHEMISYFQHERLVHLIITLFFSLLTFAGFLLTLVIRADNLLLLYALDTLFLVLTVAYIIYYFRLENTLQQMYLLTRKIHASSSCCAEKDNHI